ncbi:tRNA (adenine(58)-N(1))-methyltransferase TrmI [Pseudocercospora fuligena]|uniref:tRNA (adenine(58)-N(1))-methyltransferase catalytic subunit TRM61 n=1 Tax=Pseudocercospora fuligena TaxID=685502 RepID=A0A8H6RQA2_9PEZI|nr:tRNA (adenine(58)-N(1))-methyltransferase TrmI [Pseudocercospora fuligena]
MLTLSSRAHVSHAITQCRRYLSDVRPFAADDLVLLRNKRDRDAPPILRTLQPGRKIESHRGTIQHDDIIGSRPRDIVKARTSKANKAATDFRLHSVTLDDYCKLSRRLVTPIYPADANLIVSLFDLHPDADEEATAILEAGTGHGALTLHLSRAIHAANASREGPLTGDSRRAIIHSIDISPKFSAHAQTVVEGFRRGKYANNVDFHVGDVSEWLKSRQEQGPQFSHAFLDLPQSDRHLPAVAEALRTDGTLIVFNPSITQITACATKVKDDGILLDLERVIELGVNGGSGGRDWDIRFVHPKRVVEERTDSEPESEIGDSSISDHDTNLSSTMSDEAVSSRTWAMVCRPKVGERIIGGGFLGIWKKQRNMKTVH